MACGSCGAGRQKTDYVVTFRHDGSSRIVTAEDGGLVKVRQLIGAAPQGGSFKAQVRPS